MKWTFLKNLFLRDRSIEEKHQNIGISLFSVISSIFPKFKNKILMNSVFTEYTTQTMSLVFAFLLL